MVQEFYAILAIPWSFLCQLCLKQSPVSCITIHYCLTLEIARSTAADQTFPVMVYSHWLTLGPGLTLGPVFCRTFHIAPAPGQGRSLGKHLHVLNKAPFSPCSNVIAFFEKT